MKLALLFLGLAAVKDRDFPIAPQREIVTEYGCTATLTSPDKGKTQWWHVHVFAVYPDGHRWTKLYAIRDGKETAKALKDCSDYLDSQRADKQA